MLKYSSAKCVKTSSSQQAWSVWGWTPLPPTSTQGLTGRFKEAENCVNHMKGSGLFHPAGTCGRFFERCVLEWSPVLFQRGVELVPSWIEAVWVVYGGTTLLLTCLSCIFFPFICHACVCLYFAKIIHEKMFKCFSLTSSLANHKDLSYTKWSELRSTESNFHLQSPACVLAFTSIGTQFCGQSKKSFTEKWNIKLNVISVTDLYWFCLWIPSCNRKKEMWYVGVSWC